MHIRPRRTNPSPSPGSIEDARGTAPLRSLRRSPRNFRARVLWLVLALLVQPGTGNADEPSTYDAFVVVRPDASLARAIENGENLYLLPGTHSLDNPIVVDRDRPLRLHGADRMNVRIVPRHPDRPLFVVERAPLVNLTGLSLQQGPDSSRPGFVAVETRGEGPARLEIQDCTIVAAGLAFTGGGSVRLQGTSLMPRGLLAAPIVLDHPDVRFLMVGGNISNLKSPARFPPLSSVHVWAKRGQVRIVGTGLQATHGVADIRIDSESSSGPHAIVNVRSEGNNGSRAGERPSRLLFVPASDARVDVLLVSNSAAWGAQRPGAGALADYSAAGTLWLVGNNGSVGAGSLVTGTAPRATWVAFGNLAFDGDRLFEGRSARAFADLNLFAYRVQSGIPLPPMVRFAPDQEPDERARPAVPSIDLPPPLTRPTVGSPLPGLLDVRRFGAVGDGRTDDSAAIQSALDADCDGRDAKRLFFPAGTYRLKRTLRLNHRQAGCRKHPSGGWIAGAGRDRTILLREGGGSVFETEGLAFATVQGMTFRGADSSSGTVFALENAPDVGPASQGVSFYDVRFEGGSQGLGIGLESSTQCSENLVVDGEFANSAHGLAVGSYNALANVVYRGSFVGNAVAMGHVSGMLTGGTWTILGARVRGTRVQDLDLRNSASGVWYFYGLDSDSTRLVQTPVTGAAFPLVFDHVLLAPPPASESGSGDESLVDFAAAGGLVFLRSDVARGRIRLRGTLAANYAIADESRVPSWGAIQNGRHGRSRSTDRSLPRPASSGSR